MSEPNEVAADRSTAASRVPIERDELPAVDGTTGGYEVSEPADGVKVGGYARLIEEEPEEEPEPALMPWVAVVWLVLAGMLAAALWEVLSSGIL